MHIKEVIDAGGTFEQVLSILNIAAHSNVPINYGKMKTLEQLATMPLESLQALLVTERAFRTRRQHEDIESARRRGVAFGRPEKEVSKNYSEVMKSFLHGELSGLQAAAACNMPYSTFMWRARKAKAARDFE